MCKAAKHPGTFKNSLGTPNCTFFLSVSFSMLITPIRSYFLPKSFRNSLKAKQKRSGTFSSQPRCHNSSAVPDDPCLPSDDAERNKATERKTPAYSRFQVDCFTLAISPVHLADLFSWLLSHDCFARENLGCFTRHNISTPTGSHPEMEAYKSPLPCFF